jgi:molybdopterin-guanine dinucleotide biosynthesis protein A
VATDLPYLDEHTVNLLISKRNPAKQLTLFQQSGSGFLEPLCAIYEPDAYEQIKKEQEKGEYALHRIFRPGQMELIKYDEGESLTNLNYPDQLKKIRKQA